MEREFNVVEFDGDIREIVDKVFDSFKEQSNDVIKCPFHYRGDGVVECKRAVASMAAGYDNANLSSAIAHRLQAAVEYIWRAPLKNGEQDIRKAMEELQIALDMWDD